MKVHSAGVAGEVDGGLEGGGGDAVDFHCSLICFFGRVDPSQLTEVAPALQSLSVLCASSVQPSCSLQATYTSPCCCYRLQATASVYRDTASFPANVHRDTACYHSQQTQ